MDVIGEEEGLFSQNSEEGLSLYPENGIKIEGFYGDRGDCEL